MGLLWPKCGGVGIVGSPIIIGRYDLPKTESLTGSKIFARKGG